MALRKSTENSQGHTGDYWDIVSIHMDISGDAMDVRLELYKDAAAKSAGKSSMGISKNITISPLPDSLNGILTGIFGQVKIKVMTDQEADETPFFNGATDI